jgi:hypothetical protein
MWALSQAGGVSRKGERGRCSRLTEFYARVHVGAVASHSKFTQG